MDGEKYVEFPLKKKENLKDQLASYIAVNLCSLPDSERDQVVRAARRKADGASIVGSDIWRMIPPHVDLNTAAGLVRGAGYLTGALLGASPQQRVADVLADAQGIADGIPFANDPTGASPEPTAAAVLLQSMAEHGDPDMNDPEVIGALVSIAQHYDCAEHRLPLGGGLFDGLKTWWQGNFGSEAEKAAYQAEKQAKKAAKAAQKESESKASSVTALVKAGIPYQEAYERVYGAEVEPSITGAEASAPMSALETEAVPAPVDISESVARFKGTLEQAKSRLAEEKEAAENAAVQLARLRWAEAALNAPVKVATLMQGVDPDWTSVGGALQTAMDLLAQAKEDGDVPTLKVFARLFSAFKKKRPQASDLISSILGGDPEDFLAALRAESEVGPHYAEQLQDFLRAKAAAEDFTKAGDIPGDVRKEVAEL